MLWGASSGTDKVSQCFWGWKRMEGGLREQIAVGDDTVNGPGRPVGQRQAARRHRAPVRGCVENQFCGLNGRGQA